MRDPGTGLLSQLSASQHQTISRGVPHGVLHGVPHVVLHGVLHGVLHVLPDVVSDDLSSRPAPLLVGQSVAAQPDVERGETAWC